MANGRQVINPFSNNRNCLKHNINTSKWLPTQTRYHKQQPQPWSSRNSYYNSSTHGFSSTSSAWQATEDELSPPTTLSSQNSWAEPTSNSSIFPKRKAHYDSQVHVNGSSDCVHIDHGGKYSNMARPPCGPFTAEPRKTAQSRGKQKPKPQPNPPHFLWEKCKSKQSDRSSLMSNLYRDIDYIYAIGSGEDDDQTVWEDFYNTEKTCKEAEISQEMWLPQTYKMPDKKSPPTTRDVGTDVGTETAPWLLASPPLRLNKEDEIARKEFENPIRRVDSCVSAGDASQTTLDILIGIDGNLLPWADVDKPLPPIPLCPKPVPKVAPRKRQATAMVAPYMTGIVGLGMPYPTRWDGDTHRLEGDQSTLKECHPIPWLKSIIDKHREKAHSYLKATISYPHPITARSRGPITNLPTECGGIGGPAATRIIEINQRGTTPINYDHTNKKKAQRNPLLNCEPPSKWKANQRPAKDNKSSMNNWRRVLETLATSASKLTSVRSKKRDSSDLSFVCRGVASAASSGYTTPIRPPAARKKPNLNLGGQDVGHRPLRIGNQDDGDWI